MPGKDLRRLERRKLRMELSLLSTTAATSVWLNTSGIIHSRSKNSLSMSWARNRSALVRES